MYGCLFLWGLLTIIVITALIDRTIHPYMKGISGLDFKHYVIITTGVIGFLVLLRALHWFIQQKNTKEKINHVKLP